MKIGILKESLCLGGTERSAANISRILSSGHDVDLILYDGSDVKYSFGGKLVDFKLPAKRGFVKKIINNIFRIFKYYRLIKQEKFDVLYEFISINSPISRLKHKSVIRIISARDFSVLSADTDRFNRCLLSADALICNSQYLREYFISQYPQQRQNVFAVYNFIDVREIETHGLEIAEAEFDRFLSLHNDSIISVGRFCKEKGFEYLIESIYLARKANNNIGLVLVGDGEYKQKYLEVIDRLNLKEHVYFTGFQKNPYKYMSKCSCFVLSSLSEGFPNVLAEAMALRLPVIAVNCYSGPAEILRKDADYSAVVKSYEKCDYGILTPEMKSSDNTNAISELAKAVVDMTLNTELREKYAQLAYQRALDFSEEATRDRLEAIFHELISRKK